MKQLILTEKPSVARDFANALGVRFSSSQDGVIENESFVITWAIGHLLTPFDPEEYDPAYKKWQLNTLPILPKVFMYKPQKATKKQYDIVKKQLKRSDISQLVVATDAGREGELIARLILNESSFKKKAVRFWTSAALTREVILEGLKKAKPLSEYDRLYEAGVARQKADWLVGMNFSRLATLKLNDLFSVGRVQTAVLGLLVERRKEIENFVPKDYFELKAIFQFDRSKVDTYWFDPEKKQDEKRLDKKEDLDKIQNKINGKSAKIKKLDKEEKKQFPQGLFSLTELQRQANMLYGLSASKTLEIAQELYEKHKCLSYPRTDSKVMATSSFDLIKGLVSRFQESYPEYYEKFEPFKVSLKNKFVFDDSRLTDHHGLIPLKEFKGPENTFEYKIYHLVLKKFLTNFMKDHIYEETLVEIECEGEFFKTRGKKIVEDGFKVLEGKTQEELLEDLDKKIEGICVNSEVESKKTKPPFEYTESSLLYDMTNPARLVKESEHKKIFRSEIGLGTQATRAQIIETLLKRSYVERNGKNLKATLKGVALIDELSSLSYSRKLTSVEQTAVLELDLQSMADGSRKIGSFITDVEKLIVDAVGEWKTKTSQEFKSKDENAATKKQYSQNKSGSKASSQFKEVGVCPQCKKNIIDYPKSFSCSGWKEGCKFTIWKVVAGKSISEAQFKKILKSGRTDKLKGFKSKTGKEFEATLVLGQDGKLNFEF